jgi:transposase-like protein
VDGAAVAKAEHSKRQRRSIAEKHKIVELAMQPWSIVACVAREHGVNANMVHYWGTSIARVGLGEKLSNRSAKDRSHSRDETPIVFLRGDCRTARLQTPPCVLPV